MVDPETRISRGQLVDRAGVASPFVERLCELAILTPDREGGFGVSDVYRVRLVAACERSGMGPEAIARAIGDGRLSLAFLDRPQYRWAALGTETLGSSRSDSISRSTWFARSPGRSVDGAPR
jgi:hypothetical protein